MMTMKYVKVPEGLNEYGNFGPAPGEAMPKPRPEMLRRMELDRVKKEERRPLAEQFQEGTATYHGLTMPFRLYVPKDLEPGRKYPLVLFLHGGGERGDDNISQLLAYDGALVWTRQAEPCFVLAPQCPEGEPGWMEKHCLVARTAMSQVMEAYPIDPERLYLTGMSMGGGGCWRMNYMFPELFAAIVSVCAAACIHNRDEIIPEAIEAVADAFIGKNLWLFHAADDFVVTPESTRSLVAALERRGRRKGVDFFYTKYPKEMNLGHGSWEPAYEDTIMCRWVLAQRNRETLSPPNMGKIPPEMQKRIQEMEAEKQERSAYLSKLECRSYQEPSTARVMQYRLYRPDLAEGETCPLVIFLHGIGECGQDNEAQITAYDGAVCWIKAQEKGMLEKAYVVAPQCPLPIPGNFWEPEYVAMLGAIMKQLLAELPVDRSRIYATGLSLGGFGVWNLIRENPGMFAGAVTCCPACVAGDMFHNHVYEEGLQRCAPALMEIPLWLFHSEDDNAVPVTVTKEMAAMLEARGKKNLRVTIYPAEEGWHHGCWEPTYRNTEMMTWLFRQHQ